jgi:hypothetical protein
MNAMRSPLSVRWLMALLLGLTCLSLAALPAPAAETAATVQSSSPVATLQANVIMELVSNRTRLIQVSLVCVALGCAMLWWRR